ncbi:hypothetical protein HYFRA_00008689 [Hymenoscyphus fraxineus]|uniref:Uncharacterized protein n=1 Tax=Hymenoscyphus fraxineus TaxID=746836 RepID=A0A9N9KVD6_9HELO|nr:hypothetical protein HYFRA_00008689 [Hymenoscyphus fraxineus]
MSKNPAHPPAIDALRIDERQSIIDKIVDAIQNSPNEVIPPRQGTISTKEGVRRLWQSFESNIQPTKLTDEASSELAIGHAVWNHFFGPNKPFLESKSPQDVKAASVSRKRPRSETGEASGKTVKRAMRRKARTDPAAVTPAQDADVDAEGLRIIENIREEINRNPEVVKQAITKRNWRFIRYQWKCAFKSNQSTFPQLGESQPFFAEEPPKLSTNANSNTTSSLERLEEPVSHRENIARLHDPQPPPEQFHRHNLVLKESSTVKQTDVRDNAHDLFGPSWPVRYTLRQERTGNSVQSQPSDMEAQPEIGSYHNQSATQSTPPLRPHHDHQFTYNPPQTHHTKPAKPSNPSKNANSPPSGIRVGKSIGNRKYFSPTTSRKTHKTTPHTASRPNKPFIPRTMNHPTSSTKTQTNSQQKATPNSTMHHPLPRKPSLDLSRDVSMQPPSPEKATHPPVAQPRPSPPTETAAQRALREECAQAEKRFWIDLEESLGVNQ